MSVARFVLEGNGWLDGWTEGRKGWFCVGLMNHDYHRTLAGCKIFRLRERLRVCYEEIDCCAWRSRYQDDETAF